VTGVSSDRHEESRTDAPEGERIAVVTGATGFIGGYVCRTLLDRGWRVRGTVRHLDRTSDLPAGVEAVTWDIEREAAPAALVSGAAAIIHLAGRAHRMDASARSDIAGYRRANVEATRMLLGAARRAGVRRFVYVSSVKVLGEGERSPYAADAPLDPGDAYATSKAEAEHVVQAEAGAVRWTIVRPAFVYGAAGKGNFTRLVTLARMASRLPLPLAGLRNRRSIVYVENLADLLVFCIESEGTAGRVVPGVDRQSVSTPELLRGVAAPLGLRPRLFSLPSSLLALLSRISGRSADWHRLSSDFEVETSVLREIGWRPPISFEDSFHRSARLASAQVSA
jgi:nucleoside-diphosphate-sugar epimerase